jgi:hypothetical protein
VILPKATPKLNKKRFFNEEEEEVEEINGERQVCGCVPKTYRLTIHLVSIEFVTKNVFQFFFPNHLSNTK